MVRLSKILAFALLLTACLPAQVLRVNHGLIPASGAAWSPTSETGLILWLKADVGVFKDLGTTPAANGDGVEQWNDQSGAGANVTQTVPSNRPVLRTGIQNGLAGIVFTNSPSSWMDSTLTHAAANYTIAVVCKTSNTTTEEEIFDTQTGRMLVNYNDNNGAGSIAYYDGTHDIATANSTVDTAWHLTAWSLSSTGTGGFIYLDNVQKKNDLYTQKAIGGTTAIGATEVHDQSFQGPIGEVIIWAQAFNTTQLGNLHTYAVNRWATP